MHCLFCGKTLFFRAGPAKREFCNSEHRQQYDQLALARLLESDQPSAKPQSISIDKVRDSTTIEGGLTLSPGFVMTEPSVEGFARAETLLRSETARQPAADVVSTLVASSPAPFAPFTASPRESGMVGSPIWEHQAPSLGDKLPPIRLTLSGVVRKTSWAPVAAGLQALRPLPREFNLMPAGAIRMRPWVWPNVRPSHAARPERPQREDVPEYAPLVGVRLDPQAPSPRSMGVPEIQRQPGTCVLPAVSAKCLPPATLKPTGLRKIFPETGRETAPLPDAVPEPVGLWSLARLAFQVQNPRMETSFGLMTHRKVQLPPRDVPVHAPDTVSERKQTTLALPGLHGKPSPPQAPSRAEEPRGCEAPQTTTPKVRFSSELRRAWSLAPIPAKAAILALPLIGLVMALLAKPSLGGAPQNFPGVFERMESFVRERAAIELEDDFRTGLSGWDGDPGGVAEWAYEPAGSVTPGRLALLKESLPLSDYRLTILGQIEKKSLCWVFRASDVRNYYATKITITKPGPIPLGAIIRYAVVDGVPVDRVELPLPFSIRNDTLYRIETNVFQDRFITSVNGQVVDTFFDRRHRSGGVGLFGGPDEASRILWIRVTDRDDLFGRICAYFSRHSADSQTGLSPVVKGLARGSGTRGVN